MGYENCECYRAWKLAHSGASPPPFPTALRVGDAFPEGGNVGLLSCPTVYFLYDLRAQNHWHPQIECPAPRMCGTHCLACLHRFPDGRVGRLYACERGTPQGDPLAILMATAQSKFVLFTSGGMWMTPP